MKPPVDAPASRQRRPATVEIGECGERARQFVPAARGVSRVRCSPSMQADGRVRSTPVAGLVASYPPHLDPAGGDQVGRVLARAGHSRAAPVRRPGDVPEWPWDGRQAPSISARALRSSSCRAL